MRNKEEERELKNNAFWELHEYLESAGYFEADEEKRGEIWERIARQWNLKERGQKKNA